MPCRSGEAAEVFVHTSGAGDSTDEQHVFGRHARLDQDLHVLADGVEQTGEDALPRLALVRQVRHVRLEDHGTATREQRRRGACARPSRWPFRCRGRSARPAAGGSCRCPASSGSSPGTPRPRSPEARAPRSREHRCSRWWPRGHRPRSASPQPAPAWSERSAMTGLDSRARPRSPRTDRPIRSRRAPRVRQGPAPSGVRRSAAGSRRARRPRGPAPRPSPFPRRRRYRRSAHPEVCALP